MTETELRRDLERARELLRSAEELSEQRRQELERLRPAAFEFGLHETVRIPALSCEGLVTGRLECIRGIRYEVAWWMNGSRLTEYLYGWELARVERPAKDRP